MSINNEEFGKILSTEFDGDLEALRTLADLRGIEVYPETAEEEPFLPYDEEPIMKRQFFWLSYISKFLSKNITNEKHILDIGSNIPWLIGLAAHYDITMIDVRNHPLKHTFPFQFQQANATELPFKDCSFDVVTFPQVLHWVGTGSYGDKLNIDGDKETINEIARVLVPGGLGIFATFVVPRKTVLKIGGRRLFALNDLKNIFSTANFKIIDLTIYNSFCEKISFNDIPDLSKEPLLPGFPDEEQAWILGAVELMR